MWFVIIVLKLSTMLIETLYELLLVHLLYCYIAIVYISHKLKVIMNSIKWCSRYKRLLWMVILVLTLFIPLSFFCNYNNVHGHTAIESQTKKTYEIPNFMTSICVASWEAPLLAKGCINAINNELLNQGELSTSYGANGWVDQEKLFISYTLTIFPNYHY